MDLVRPALTYTRKYLMRLIATVGVSCLFGGAVLGARAWAAVLKVERHETELQEVKLNSYLTCLMVKQLYNERVDTVKLTLDVDLACKRPRSE